MGDGPSRRETSMLQVIISKLIKPASHAQQCVFWVMTRKAEYSR